LNKVIRAKILFFDQNPLGRIMTRFSREVTTLDLILPGLFNMVTYTGFKSLSVIIMVCVIFPQMLPIVFVVIIMMVFIVRKAKKSLGECLKADSQYKGPIHDHLSTIVNGLVTLRNY